MDQVGFELLSRLLDEHGPRLQLYAGQWCSSPEDVVQDAFIRLMQEPLPPEHPTAWLYRVVRNLALSAWRAEQRRARREAVSAQVRQPWFVTNQADAIDSQSATKALQALPDECREAVILRLWSGMSFSEIAELTEASLSTAHRRYANGLESLRAALNVPQM